MSQRRLFSTQIVGSDAFLDMPSSTRELYFHLGMYADDDGFVSPKRIMRLVGASEDDLKVLLGKRFLLAFENGVVVIKHWLIHNTIRLDRYKPTIYEEQKSLIFTKENKVYTDVQPTGNQLATIGCPKLSQVKSSQVKLSQVKTSKEIKLQAEPAEVQEIMKIFYEINPTLKWGNITERKSASMLIKRLGGEKAIASAKEAVRVFGQPYAPTITKPTQLENKLSELIAFYKKNQANKPISI